MINSVNPVTPINYNYHNYSKSPAVHVRTGASTNLLEKFMKTQAVYNAPMVSEVKPYKNDLRSLLTSNEAKILAIIPRTFNAKDENGNEYIDGTEENGTFLNAIERLDEIKAQGFNTLHILPIHPTGKMKAMGTAGSLYSPANFLEIDPNLIDKNDPRSDKEQFKAFIDECHNRGIRVMLDLPSCASYDMFLNQNDLMAKERDGMAKTPQGWNDIRMFQPWEDEGKRTLNPDLLQLHKEYVDMCVDLGIDGIRADVARAKPVEFWDVIIPYSRKLDPDFGWLAETYTYEDASPQANMPYDRPEDSWRVGFDAIYGQYHNFHEWETATEFTNYVKEVIDMSYNVDKGKSVIGSFATHDDMSPMYHGQTDYCNLTTGLQATLPMLNPYFVDGFQSGDYYAYPYENIEVEHTDTDNHEMTVHHGKLDIFNLSRKPGGKNPEIGEFMTKSLKMRDRYSDIINKGSFIELEKTGDTTDQIIAYARHYHGKTLLVVANKNIDRPISCKIKVPTLSEHEPLRNLLPTYGEKSEIQAVKDELRVNLGSARVHVFEINTPYIESYTNNVYKQH